MGVRGNRRKPDKTNGADICPDKTESGEDTGTLEKIQGILVVTLLIYLAVFFLWWLISAFGWIDALVYQPAHFLFGKFLYLDFYLRYGILVIYFYSGACVALAMLICGLLIKRKQPEKEADAVPEEDSKGPWAEFKSVLFMICAPIAACMFVAYTWNNIIPDFKMALKGEYCAVEVESDEFRASKTKKTGRRKFGYNYTVSIPDEGLEMETTPTMYGELSALSSHGKYGFTPDGKITWEQSERENVTLRFYYLPKTECLLGYAVLPESEK